MAVFTATHSSDVVVVSGTGRKLLLLLLCCKQSHRFTHEGVRYEKHESTQFAKFRCCRIKAAAAAEEGQPLIKS